MTCAAAEFAVLGRGPPPVPSRMSLVRWSCAAAEARWPSAAAAPNPAKNWRRLISRIWSAPAPNPIAAALNVWVGQRDERQPPYADAQQPYGDALVMRHDGPGAPVGRQPAGAKPRPARAC